MLEQYYSSRRHARTHPRRHHLLRPAAAAAGQAVAGETRGGHAVPHGRIEWNKSTETSVYRTKQTSQAAWNATLNKFQFFLLM